VRFIYRRSEIIAVPSRAFCTPVAMIAPGSDIRYLPNPADTAQREWTADHREGHRLKPGFRVVFAGNLGVAQGLDTVLD
ncbi:glycosyltransferase family 4 protein, partial [Streptococcus pneumoniae]|uniref:glycosyltransferase family 4 protein n=1 Tax=Streptococcus pneumoniae TaxID=1313 RepID=UPI0013D92D62